MKNTIFIAIVLFSGLTFSSSFAQEKNTAKISATSSGSSNATTKEISNEQQQVSTDENGKLKLTIKSNSQEPVEGGYSLSATNLEPIPVSTISTSEKTIISNDVTYYDNLISDLENQITMIKANQIEYDLAVKTGKIQELELKLINAKTARTKLISNK